MLRVSIIAAMINFFTVLKVKLLIINWFSAINALFPAPMSVCLPESYRRAGIVLEWQFCVFHLCSYREARHGTWNIFLCLFFQLLFAFIPFVGL
jgi:hypothetical protein